MGKELNVHYLDAPIWTSFKQNWRMFKPWFYRKIMRSITFHYDSQAAFKERNSYVIESILIRKRQSTRINSPSAGLLVRNQKNEEANVLATHWSITILWFGDISKNARRKRKLIGEILWRNHLVMNHCKKFLLISETAWSKRHLVYYTCLQGIVSLKRVWWEWNYRKLTSVVSVKRRRWSRLIWKWNTPRMQTDKGNALAWGTVD